MTRGFDAADRSLSLGAELRSARLARGLSLEDCQRATRIALRYLRALEDDQYDVLPAAVFARGFLRSYAQYLGLDASELLASYPGQGASAEFLREPGAPVDTLRSEADPPRRVQPEGAGSRGSADERLSAIPIFDPHTPAVRLGPWLVAAVVVLVVSAGVVAVVVLGGDDSPAAPPLTAPLGVVAGPSEAEEQEAVVFSEPVIALYELPDLAQRTFSNATVILRRSGLPYVVVEIFDPAAPAGTVLDQVPVPGVSVNSSTVVTLVVSRGPETAPAPEEEPPTTPDESAPEESTEESTETPAAATGGPAGYGASRPSVDRSI